jgi:hypothetical protein
MTDAKDDDARRRQVHHDERNRGPRNGAPALERPCATGATVDRPTRCSGWTVSWPHPSQSVQMLGRRGTHPGGASARFTAHLTASFRYAITDTAFAQNLTRCIDADPSPLTDVSCLRNINIDEHAFLTYSGSLFNASQAACSLLNNSSREVVISVGGSYWATLG